MTEQEVAISEHTDCPSVQTGESNNHVESAGEGSEQLESAPEAPEVQEASESLVSKLSHEQKMGLVEALLLAHGEPLSITRIQGILECSKSELLSLVERLQNSCSIEARGVEVIVLGDRLQLRTKPAFADFVRDLLAVKPRRLSQAALETLSVIAYRQPVVKSEIDKIRGVDVAPTIKTLVERQLIKILGYQASVGQPALYGTTDEFLKVFGLGSLSDLPAMHDLKVLAKEPGEALESSEGVEDDTASVEVAQEVSEAPSATQF